MIEWLYVLAGVLLTAGTALFVAAEFSLVALDRSSVQRAVDDGDTRARPVLRALGLLSTSLSAAQVGITVTTLVLGYVANPALTSLLSSGMGALGWGGSSAETIASVASLILVTLFSMLFGELVPQFLGISAPMGVAKIVAPPITVFGIIFRPLIALFNGSANAFLRLMNIEPQEELSGARTPQELVSLVSHSADAGTLEVGLAKLVAKSVDFGDRTAADVMTPRVRCAGVERDVSAAELVALTRQTGHSRFPVLDDGWDDIVGVVHVKTAVAVPFERRDDVPVAALMVDPLLVPETIRLDPLLVQLRDAGFQLAIVVDEFGGTSGVVTLEDVVEEIVGEVSDEHDRRSADSRKVAAGTWTVPGLWRPDEVNDRIGAPIPEGPAYETIGGFVMAQLGRVPQVGDLVEVPGWNVAVVRMDGHRVDQLRISQAPDGDSGHTDNDAAKEQS